MQEFTNAQKELFRVAQLTVIAGYSETVTLYSKLSNSMTAMGKSQSDIVRTVETVNKAYWVISAGNDRLPRDPDGPAERSRSRKWARVAIS